MDSASQTSASSPPNDPVALQLEPRELPLSLTQIEQRPSPIEWLIRLGLFGVVLFVIARQIGFADPNALVYPLLVYGALAAAYVLASVPA